MYNKSTHLRMTLIASYLTTDQQNIVNNKLVLQPRLELHVNLTRAHAILNEADTGFTIFMAVTLSTT